MSATVMESASTEGLRDISEVNAMSLQDEACVQEIVDVLKKYNALGRFGVTLLHKHFDIAEDELFVESCDVSTRTLTIKPFKKSELDGLNFKATSWRLDTGKPLMACVCVKGQYDHSHQSRG